MVDGAEGARSLTEIDLSFQMLVESVRDYAIFMLDKTGHVLTWNSGAEHIKGYRPHEIIGSHFSKFYPPDAIARRWPEYELERAGADGRFEDEGWRVRKDGSRFWANVVITALRDASGTLVGFSKVTRDLTERRRNEDELRQARDELEVRVRERTAELQIQRQQLQITLASIGDATITTDTGGRVTFLNPVAERLTGWSSAEAVGQQLNEVFRIVDEHSKRPLETPVQQVLALGSVVGLANHTVLVSRGGSEQVIDDSAAPIKDEDGNISGVVMIFRDVSPRRLAEDLQVRLAAIVESSQDAIIGKTLDGTITSWNKGAERLYGYRAHEVIGKNIAILIPPENEGELQNVLDRLKRGERIDAYETVRVRWNGTRLPVSVVISPIARADGQVIGASAIARDISERNETERQLREINAELRLVDERKNEFLAMLAHELRNPLAPIRNALSVLREPGASADNQRVAKDILGRQVQHLTRLVDDLLDVSRVTQDRIELRRELSDIREVLDRAVEIAQPAVTSRNQRLSMTMPPYPIDVDVDVVRIAQALSNILLNASKFSDVGSVITVIAERDRDQVAIRIKDAGKGMTAEFLPRVFDLFTQADQSLDRSEGGLGIGLALVRKLIALHGGTVEAFSGGASLGSEFVIRLPALESRTEDRKAEGPSAGSKEAARKVLIVDDSEDAAETTAMLVRLSGHEVRIAPDGLSALREVDAYNPDVVLLDIGLPGMDGYELARAIRSRPQQQHVILIAITGYGQAEGRQRSQDAGIDYHLTKPFDWSALEALITKSKPDATISDPSPSGRGPG